MAGVRGKERKFGLFQRVLMSALLLSGREMHGGVTVHAASASRVDVGTAVGAAHDGDTVSTIGYIGTSEFWFESFQNWQSEFFSVGVLALLTIWFRQKGSPQSKPVAAPTEDTGE